jgi:hypothetical protein
LLGQSLGRSTSATTARPSAGNAYLLMWAFCRVARKTCCLPLCSWWPRRPSCGLHTWYANSSQGGRHCCSPQFPNQCRASSQVPGLPSSAGDASTAAALLLLLLCLGSLVMAWATEPGILHVIAHDRDTPQETWYIHDRFTDDEFELVRPPPDGTRTMAGAGSWAATHVCACACVVALPCCRNNFGRNSAERQAIASRASITSVHGYAGHGATRMRVQYLTACPIC